MSNSEESTAGPLDRLAFVVTVGAAVLVGLFTLWGAVASGSSFANGAAGFFTGVTAVGGVAMGLLYLRRRLTKNNA